MDLIKPKLCAKHVLGMILNVLSLKDQFSKYVNGMRDPPLTFLISICYFWNPAQPAAAHLASNDLQNFCLNSGPDVTGKFFL